jgi:hypothetical protein
MYKHPKGITLNHTGQLYKQVIQGFWRFAPLFKEKKKGNSKPSPEDIEHCVHRSYGQIMTMGIITVTQQYNELITQGGLVVHPNPSWEAIDFSNNVDDMECAQHLTKQGVTSDEVFDASQYAFTWLKHSDNSKKEMQMHILINTLQDQARY